MNKRRSKMSLKMEDTMMNACIDVRVIPKFIEMLEDIFRETERIMDEGKLERNDWVLCQICGSDTYDWRLVKVKPPYEETLEIGSKDCYVGYGKVLVPKGLLVNVDKMEEV